jgi:peroxiredoxin
MRKSVLPVLLLALVASSCTSGYEGMSEEKLADQPVAGFTLTSLEGREVSLGDYLGKKVVVLNFTTLFHSESEATDERLLLVRRDYRDLEILSIFGESESVRLQEARGFTPLYRSRRAGELLIDPDHAVINAFQVTEAPTLVLIDREGKMRYWGHDAWELEEAVKRFAEGRR